MAFSTRPRITTLRVIACIGVVIVSVTMAVLLLKFSVDVPYLDEWDLTPMVVKNQQGQFAWADYWAQHNEHRVFFPELIMMALIKVSRWNVLTEIWASFIFVIGMLITFERLLAKTVQTRWQPFLLLAMTLFLFSPVQVRNWNSGFQVCWFIFNFSFIVAILFLIAWPGRWQSLLLALVAMVIATYSAGSGILVPVTLSIGVIIQRRSWKINQIVLWLVSSAVCLGFYFYDYHMTSGLLEALKQPLILLIFVTVYLGAPLGVWANFGLSCLIGTFALLLLGFATHWLWRNSRLIDPKILEKLLPWYLLVFFTLSNAFLTSIGRSGGNVGEATSTRYMSVTNLFWVGLIVILFVVLRELYHRPAFRQPGAITGLVAGLGVITLLCWAGSFFYGYTEMQKYQGELEYGLYTVINYDKVPADQFLIIHPRTVETQGYASLLSQLQVGPFRPGNEQNRQEVIIKWQDRVVPDYYENENRLVYSE